MPVLASASREHSYLDKMNANQLLVRAQLPSRTPAHVEAASCRAALSACRSSLEE